MDVIEYTKCKREASTLFTAECRAAPDVGNPGIGKGWTFDPQALAEARASVILTQVCAHATAVPNRRLVPDPDSRYPRRTRAASAERSDDREDHQRSDEMGELSVVPREPDADGKPRQERHGQDETQHNPGGAEASEQRQHCRSESPEWGQNDGPN